MMRPIFAFALLCASLAAQPAPPMLLRSIPFDAGLRHFRVHVPPGYDPGTPTAVVLAFHGGGGNARQFADSNGLWPSADRHGFLLVYPEGTPAHPAFPFRIQTWNAGDCCAGAMQAQVDDVGFVRALLDALEREWNVDARRVFATGFSNGGMMSYRLAVELPDRIAAVAPVGAALAVGTTPPRPVPLLAIHGALDARVPWRGGIGASGRVFRSQEDSLAPFVAVNRAALPTGVVRTVGNHAFYYEGRARRTRATVGYWWLTDQGHTWPGHPATLNPNEPFSTDLDVNEEIWTFFAAHPRSTARRVLPAGCSRLQPDLEIGTPRLHATVDVALHGAPSGVVGTLYAGPATSTPAAASGCAAWVDPRFAAVLHTARTDATGRLTTVIPLPDDWTLVGTTWHLQVLFDPGAAPPSRAVAVTLGY